jgi:hypothetical protein
MSPQQSQLKAVLGSSSSHYGGNTNATGAKLNRKSSDQEHNTPPTTHTDAPNLKLITTKRESTTLTQDNHLLVDAKMPSKGFCLPWTINVDDWWTHHPRYAVQYENGTHYCFAPIRSKVKSNLFASLYKNQFRKKKNNSDDDNCSNVVTQKMIDSGWGADFAHVVDAMYYGLQNNIPVQVSNDRPWHYAKSKNKGSNATCSLESMYCYFLNLTNCPPRNDKAFEGNGTSEFFIGHPNLADKGTSWLVEYVTRPQTWLRKAVFDFTKIIPLTTPCAVIHVRRADVVLHHKYSRRYHAIEEYVDKLLLNVSLSSNNNNNYNTSILLLTDDDNAIQEAHTKFPNRNWVYIDRPRFKGAEGGWENQIPSNDAKQEVIALLSIFKLVRKCQTFVHTSSNLAKYIAGVMMLNTNINNARGRRSNNNVNIIDLDAGLPTDVVHNSDYHVAVDDSSSLLLSKKSSDKKKKKRARM